MISLIVARAKNNVIGINGQMPWHIPSELQYFKEKTLNKIVVMGRNTFNSIKKPLPNRTNIIISSTLHLNDKDCFTLPSIQKAIEYAKNQDICFIGGTNIYKEVIPYVDVMYITEIEKEFEGDTYFPDFDETSFEKHLIKHVDELIPYTCYEYKRKSNT